MTLHEAIVVVIADDRNKRKTAAEIAHAVARKALYRRKDGTCAPPSQVRSRITGALQRYTPLFEIDRRGNPHRYRLSPAGKRLAQGLRG